MIFIKIQIFQANGFILYQTKLTTPNVNGRVLSIPKLHDRAYIQIGNSHVGVLYRMGDLSLKINLPDNRNDTLYIIVENMGRLNFGDDMLDAKVKIFITLRHHANIVVLKLREYWKECF